MERLLLCLDELDDWLFTCALIAERLRHMGTKLGIVVLALVLQFGLIAIALQRPTFGAAVAALLTVAALYRSATLPTQTPARRALA